MDKEQLEQALERNGLPSLGKILGKSFILSYKDKTNSCSGIIAGIITGVALSDDEFGDISLYISVSRLPTADDIYGCIHYLSPGLSDNWAIVTDLDRESFPIGKLQFLDD